jgi:hypothetical protein
MGLTLVVGIFGFMHGGTTLAMGNQRPIRIRGDRVPNLQSHWTGHANPSAGESRRGSCDSNLRGIRAVANAVLPNPQERYL